MQFPVIALTALLLQSSADSFGLMRSSSRSAASRLSSKFGRRSIATATPSFFAAAATTTTTCPSSASRISSLSSPFSTLLTKTRGGSSSMSTTTTALNAAATADAEQAAAPPKEVFRNDYAPLPYTVETVNMSFVIQDGVTTVTSQLHLAKNPKQTDATVDMVLDGDETCVKLLTLTLDGRALVAGDDYEIVPGKLIIQADTLQKAAAGVLLETVVEIVPEDNTQLSGLYKSGPMYCSQCEAMGFRRITYYPDRPDNMAIFNEIRIEADQELYPVLLSNGNLVKEGTLENSDDARPRHYAVWSDPFPKPSYLFCVVAGNLGSIQDSYTTTSGRAVQLEIFSEPQNVNKLDYAMESLKRSMQWDEDSFGLEYDLNVYNIVAVNDFNMGAMENKGLNVFNTAYVLADPASATDSDYERVEGVIGHEYFHNWTGNRVTCRDWFQLTLKEGLTVFRDQEFSGDMGSNAVKRIEDVRGLRGRQFQEDNSPMSHPIRPESYISMDNFYTATVYSKGAEVIRMYQTLLTKAGFRKGMDLYFERHDGQAVTCDDFRAAMADANGVDLEQFALWYSTPGTPTVTYTTEYDSDSGTFSLTLKQQSQNAAPLHIPISVGLLDQETGDEVVETTVLELKEMEQTFTFSDLKGPVVPSMLRDFSAPIKLVPDGSSSSNEEDLAFLAARDTNGFNKWEAGQKLYTSLIFQTLQDGAPLPKTLDLCMEAFGRTLADKETTDYSIQAYALTLPGESTLAEQMKVIDPVGIHKARGAMKQAIARQFQTQLMERYQELSNDTKANNDSFQVDATSVGKRRLRNMLLDYLSSIQETDAEKTAAADVCLAHFENASGMTDQMAALNCLASMDGAAARDEALETFYKNAQGDALILNKWFSVQALANLPNVLENVVALTEHPDFTLSNPNRCRSLISAFCMNAAYFHDESGKGYEFLGGILETLDKMNPQISSRMAGSLIQWRRYDETRGALMKKQLERLVTMKPISDDLFEVVNRGLKE